MTKPNLLGSSIGCCHLLLQNGQYTKGWSFNVPDLDNSFKKKSETVVYSKDYRNFFCYQPQLVLLPK